METKQENSPKKLVVVGRASFSEVINTEATEKKVQGRINWGEDNCYPYDLEAYRQDNPIHGGIINQKITYMSAAGVDIVGLDPVLAEQVQEIIPEIVDDFEMLNGFAVIFKKSGKTWVTEQIDVASVRYMCEGHFFEVSDDWTTKSQSLEKTNYRKIKDICYAVLEGDEADEELLFFAKIKPKQRRLKNKKITLGYYPIPNYVGATVSILAGIEQSYFTYSETRNGFKGGTLIGMNNGMPPTEEAADEIADKIKEEATNRETQGGIIVSFSDGADNAPTVQQLNGNDLDKRYTESRKDIRDEIMIGHQAGSPTLFSVNSASMFGTKEEMETAYALFSNNYVNKRQKFIADAMEWAFARIGMKGVKLTFKKYVLSLTQEADDDNRTLRQINSMSPLVANKVLDSMSRDEIRQLAKLAADGSKMASALVAKLILAGLGKVGLKRSDMKVLHSRTFDMESSDEDFLATFEDFASLTKTQQLVLKMIQDGSSFNDISKAVGKGALALSIELVKLRVGGYLKGWKVIKPEAVSIEVRYSYEVKAGLGAKIIDTSREFCVDLIELDRLYTRTEIDTLSNEVGTDVWRYRGGWYTNPKTGVTTPSCRHEWKQNVVKK